MKRVLAFCTIVLILLCALFSCNTDGEVPDYIGIWFASNVVTPGGNFDAQVTLNEDGTYETLLYNVGGSTLQAGSSRGTYTCANNIFSAQQKEQYNGSAWVAAPGTLPPAAYIVSEDGNTLTLIQDFDEDGNIDATWTMTRQ
jgi:hypothetical protein